MSPTGLCFTPHVNIKKSMDLFGESQAAHALAIEIDWETRTSKLHVTATAFIRLSPIAYFYRKASKEKRRTILVDLSKRMFGKFSSLNIVEMYIELLVRALNGQSKESILQSIDRDQIDSRNNYLSQIFSQLVDSLHNDENQIEIGIDRILQQINKMNSFVEEEQCRYLNPFDADSTILLSLYLQLATAIYNCLPKQISSENIYAFSMIKLLIKWIFYQSEKKNDDEHLH